ncbi:MAG: IS1595 family transposase [Beijerinckiaceae bacterium]
MASVLQEPYFQDEEAAFERLEAIVWANGPVCPKCGCSGRISALNGVKDKKGRERLGLKKCYDCRGQFTVRVGTIFERSHVPLHIWFQGAYLMCSSKKGVSSNQLHRTLGVTLQTAWFMSHRLREAVRTGSLAPMGGTGGTVEIDETFIGKKPGASKRRGYAHKNAVLSLVERSTGQVRSFHVDGTSAAHLVPIIRANIAKESAIMTDEAGQYAHLNKDFTSHEFVRHSAEEYVRGDVHTNTVEGFYSIFKRGMKGVYQHCSEKHLHRYVAEFDFRYNNRVRLGIDDEDRTTRVLRGIIGKRLTYRDSLAASI